MNLTGDSCVPPGMKPISPVHISEPGLVVVDIAARDEETALAATRSTRAPMHPGR
ncbi:DUF6207 family protein [Streptomyces sp. NBC_00191]|uniref:DUF6207 family protein n=1 Tax=Streptomyces sp. NBC_00191 TaxID=2975674 RepID=UPI003252A556